MDYTVKPYPGAKSLVTLHENGDEFLHFTHKQLADLYIALTDYYADNKEN